MQTKHKKKTVKNKPYVSFFLQSSVEKNIKYKKIEKTYSFR